jgi:hypothetical protein
MTSAANRKGGQQRSYKDMIDDLWVNVNKRFTALYADFTRSTDAISHQLSMLNTNVAILFNAECTDDKTDDVTNIIMNKERSEFLRKAYTQDRGKFTILYKYAMQFQKAQNNEAKVALLNSLFSDFTKSKIK